MTPKEIVDRLIEIGWTQDEIAEHVGVAQSTIHRIRTDETKNPAYQIVDRLRSVANDIEGFRSWRH